MLLFAINAGERCQYINSITKSVTIRVLLYELQKMKKSDHKDVLNELQKMKKGDHKALNPLVLLG